MSQVSRELDLEVAWVAWVERVGWISDSSRVEQCAFPVLDRKTERTAAMAEMVPTVALYPELRRETAQL